MAIMKKTVAPKAAKPAPAFLQAGGEIQKIAKGVSGQVYGPSRQITISKKR